MELSVAEAYHTQDEEVRAYQEHLLSKEALEASQREPSDTHANTSEPVIFSD